MAVEKYMYYNIIFLSPDQGLNLYKFLAPNAYSQLSGHVEIVDRIAVSHVYDVRFTLANNSVVCYN